MNYTTKIMNDNFDMIHRLNLESHSKTELEEIKELAMEEAMEFGEINHTYECDDVIIELQKQGDDYTITNIKYNNGK